ncbi:hypothetical protein [Senegalimassilia sp.]
MIIKQDERFQLAADAQLDIWCAQDEGGYADDSARFLRRLIERLADEYGLSKATVSALVARRALEDYE